MVILITGGMGFIGLHTARAFLDAGEEVVLTRFRTWRAPDFIEEEVGSRVRVETLDLSDGWGLLDVINRHAVTGVVHLASPPRGTAPAQEFAAALGGLVNVLEAGRQRGLGRISVASSVSVYSNTGPGPWREEIPLPVESDSHIAATKKAMEIVALNFADRTGQDVRVLRLAGIYGPLYHSMANLPSRLCHAAATGAAPDLGSVRGGSPLRDDAADLCYVKDCAHGVRLVQLAGGLRHRVYNVGVGCATTNQELVDAVCAAAPAATFTFPVGGSGQSGAEHAFMDIARLRADTGYTPAYDIQRGVADYMDWLSRHPEQPPIGAAAGHPAKVGRV
jgi:UDP-glucose 4-epimerase